MTKLKEIFKLEKQAILLPEMSQIQNFVYIDQTFNALQE